MISQACIFIACAVFSAQAQCFGPVESCGSCDNVAPISSGFIGSEFQSNYQQQPQFNVELQSPFGYSGSSCSENFAPVSFGSSLPVLESLSAQSQYPISSGPSPVRLPTVEAPSIVVKGRPLPLIALPSPPRPQIRVVDDKCICTKTVLNNQQIKRRVIVPSVQPILKKFYKSVVENIPYNAQASRGYETAYPQALEVGAFPQALEVGVFPQSCGASSFRQPLELEVGSYPLFASGNFAEKYGSCSSC